jgi:hypothetical protein
VIDINLPISGSLNDPQFSLGPVIFKVIVNLIVKAVTAPFSLLASAVGGGGDELSTVAFAPGRRRWHARGPAGLDKVAKALHRRPALKMTVVGTASLEVSAKPQARAPASAGAGREAPRRGTGRLDGPVAEPHEYPALLKEVYRRADMPKPRNLVGMAKDLPRAEMEALLLANIRVTEDRCASWRCSAAWPCATTWPARTCRLERLFLGAAKAVPRRGRCWTNPPRAELNLAAPLSPRAETHRCRVSR